MENPNTWNNIQYAIDEAIVKYYANEHAGMIGLSLTTTIYNALMAKHYINKELIKIEVKDDYGRTIGKQG